MAADGSREGRQIAECAHSWHEEISAAAYSDETGNGADSRAASEMRDCEVRRRAPFMAWPETTALADERIDFVVKSAKLWVVAPA